MELQLTIATTNFACIKSMEHSRMIRPRRALPVMSGVELVTIKIYLVMVSLSFAIIVLTFRHSTITNTCVV